MKRPRLLLVSLLWSKSFRGPDLHSGKVITPVYDQAQEWAVYDESRASEGGLSGGPGWSSMTFPGSPSTK